MSRNRKRFESNKQRKSNHQQRTSRVTIDVRLEEEIVLFDMRSCNTTRLKIYEQPGGFTIAFQVPANIRISRNGL